LSAPRNRPGRSSRRPSGRGSSCCRCSLSSVPRCLLRCRGRHPTPVTCPVVTQLTPGITRIFGRIGRDPTSERENPTLCPVYGCRRTRTRGLSKHRRRPRCGADPAIVKLPDPERPRPSVPGASTASLDAYCHVGCVHTQSEGGSGALVAAFSTTPGPPAPAGYVTTGVSGTLCLHA